MNGLLSAKLWSKAIAAHLLEDNELIATFDYGRKIEVAPDYDPYEKEKAILRRLNRCKTKRGKLKALAAVLQNIRDECGDY